MASSSSSILPILLLLALSISFFSLPSSSAPAVNCGEIASKFAPCLQYLIGRSNSPTPACCSNIQALNAKFTGPSRVGACQCIKKNAAAITNLRQDRAASIATACNVPVSIKISPTTDCSKA